MNRPSPSGGAVHGRPTSPPNEGSRYTAEPASTVHRRPRNARKDGGPGKVAVVEQFGSRSVVHAQTHITLRFPFDCQPIGHGLLLLRVASVVVAALLRTLLQLVLYTE